MRGKPASRRSFATASGITPAGAGKTSRRGVKCFKMRDHPRRCGENQKNSIMAKVTKGSPPQVRGKPSLPHIQPTCVRITPAGAGKTTMQYNRPLLHTDHPRRCGENITAPDELGNVLGSPPQVRGKQRHSRDILPLSGITPAGAGKTAVGHGCG